MPVPILSNAVSPNNPDGIVAKRHLETAASQTAHVDAQQQNPFVEQWHGGVSSLSGQDAANFGCILA